MVMKRKRETTDTANSKPQSNENPKSPTKKEEEMAFQWSEEKMTALMEEIYECRASRGSYNGLAGSSFNKRGTRWNELYESLVKGREEFRCMEFVEMSDKIVYLESLAHREVLRGGFVDDENETPFRRAMYRAFEQSSLCPPPGITNRPQGPPHSRIVRRRLANTSGTASTSQNASAQFNF